MSLLVSMRGDHCGSSIPSQEWGKSVYSRELQSGCRFQHMLSAVEAETDLLPGENDDFRSLSSQNGFLTLKKADADAFTLSTHLFCTSSPIGLKLYYLCPHSQLREPILIVVFCPISISNIVHLPMPSRGFPNSASRQGRVLSTLITKGKGDILGSLQSYLMQKSQCSRVQGGFEMKMRSCGILRSIASHRAEQEAVG